MGTPRYKFGIAVADNQLFFAGTREKEDYTVDILTVDPSGTENVFIRQDLIELYPNPVGETLNIRFSNDATDQYLENIDLYSRAGRKA